MQTLLNHMGIQTWTSRKALPGAKQCQQIGVYQIAFSPNNEVYLVIYAGKSQKINDFIGNLMAYYHLQIQELALKEIPKDSNVLVFVLDGCEGALELENVTVIKNKKSLWQKLNQLKVAVTYE